ncbi:MAG TPA: pyridoxamine 5'-phosphate oxidase family protein, partial [Clostridiaceae bacterium]|nr:pyridoxamine 5'-phosphate oxidase family protein [Clostridiaceae bacterium]
GLLHNPAVSIACVGDVTPRTDDFTTEFESALIAGRAVRVTEDEEKIAALRAISLRYTPDNMDRFDDAVARSLSRTDVWRVSMDQVTGKQKKYGPDGREIKSGISK